MAEAREHGGPPDACRHVGHGAVEIVAPFGGRGRFDAEAQEAQAKASVRMASDEFSVRITGRVRVEF